MALISRRCPKHCRNWPDLENYSICPVCGSGTARFRGLKPISEEEAVSARKHAEFDLYYATEHVPDADLDSLDIELAGLSSSLVPPA